MTDAIHVGAVAAECTKRLEDLLALWEDTRHRLTVWVDETHQSAVEVCSKHGTDRPIDWERTVVETMRTGECVVVYATCARCEEEASSASRERWLLSRGVPSVLVGCTFENYSVTQDNREVYSALKKWSVRPRGMALVSSPTGLGKSHLAVAVMRTSPLRGLFVVGGTIAETLRRPYRDNPPDIVAICKRVPLLILDDLGVDDSGAADTALHSIVNHRHGEKLPILITTNVQPSELIKSLGDRAADRVREMLAVNKRMSGSSWRSREKYD